MTIHVVLIVLAIISWVLAALNIPSPRINLVALGLVFFGISLLV